MKVMLMKTDPMKGILKEIYYLILTQVGSPNSALSHDVQYSLILGLSNKTIASDSIVDEKSAGNLGA